jgi:cytochrome c biogenesis protein CcdA
MKILKWIKDNFMALFDELSFAGSTIGARLYFSASLFSVFMFFGVLLPKANRTSNDRAQAAFVFCLMLLIAVQLLYFLISGRPEDRPADSSIVSRSKRIFVWSVLGIFLIGLIFGKG